MHKSLLAVGVVFLLGSSVALGEPDTYLTGKVGPLWFLGDFDDLDTGVNLNAAIGIKPIEFLAFELESGYFWGEDTGAVDVELWGVPMLANARLTIPLFFLELSAGLGVGGFYLSSEAGSADDDDWVFGGDAFAGVGFSLGPVTLGVEAKYYLTEEADLFGQGVEFEGIAAMATARLDF